MTPFESDLLKILIDKGLLAGILLIAGFWLNRALERFRARHTYMQKVADARLQALGEVNEALFMHSMNVQKLRNLILGEASLKLKEEIRTNLIQQGYADTAKAVTEAQATVYKHLVFLPKELSEPLLRYFDHDLEIIQLMADKTAAEFSSKFNKATEQLLAQAGEIHKQIIVEINSNPFKNELG